MDDSKAKYLVWVFLLLLLLWGFYRSTFLTMGGESEVEDFVIDVPGLIGRSPTEIRYIDKQRPNAGPTTDCCTRENLFTEPYRNIRLPDPLPPPKPLPEIVVEYVSPPERFYYVGVMAHFAGGSGMARIANHPQPLHNGGSWKVATHGLPRMWTIRGSRGTETTAYVPGDWHLKYKTQNDAITAGYFTWPKDFRLF